MKKQYWYGNRTYQDKIKLIGVLLIWIVFGVYILLDSWFIRSKFQTPLFILPVNMFALSLVHWYLQKKPGSNAWQDRTLLIISALLLISFTALWVYEI